jgi:hypothetical protein
MLNTLRSLARKARRTAAGNVIDTPVFFIHVPKCGGTSIQVAIEEAYGLQSGLRIDLWGNIHHGAFFKLNSHASKEAADRLGVPLHQLREHILLYQMSCSGRRFISGHFQFSDAAYAGYHSTYTFVSLLRDPVERWYSQYFFNRDKKDDHFIVEDAIDDYLTSPRGRSTGRLIARYFAGVDCGEDDIVEEAIQNIAKFDVVGVLDDLGTFKSDLRYVLGADINIPVRNASPTSAAQKRKEITPEIHRRVVEVCQPDQAVYDYVVKNLIGRHNPR